MQKEPQEVIRKAMVAQFDPSHLTSSTKAIDHILKQNELNEKVKYGRLQNCALKVKEFSVYHL